jgi:hypothetical protein
VYDYGSGNETGIPESVDSVSPVLNPEDKETEDVIQEQRGLEWNIIVIDS